MKKLTMHTPDQVQGNIASIRELFPHCVTEGKDERGQTQWRVDFDLLRQELSGDLIENPQDERYHINWPGKREALVIANSPIAKTLRPCQADSVQFDSTQNLYIEGDNLDALKLLQNPYLGKVKMIYIDPPYNTGHDFIYKDNFSQASKDYLQRSNQTDEEGARLVENTEANGRFHSDWLSMMYPRLKVCKYLLPSDGIIAISIDDSELHNLLQMANELFGTQNHIGTFVWVKKQKGSHLSKTTRKMTEYVVIFANDIRQIELVGESAYSDKWQPLAKRTNSRKQLFFSSEIIETTLNDGFYEAGTYGKGTSALTFPESFNVLSGKITNNIKIDGPFVWTQSKLDEELNLGSRVALSKKFGLNVLRHDQDSKVKRPSTLIDKNIGVGTNEDAYQEGIDIFKIEGVMSYPKPVSLIKFLIKTCTFNDNEALILDFFSGSSTTAHAVMQLNAEDGGNRKFIMVQLPEQCAPQSEAYKAGFATIAEIGKERIRRAGQKITQGECHANWAQDIGFRVLKIDSANISDVALRPQDTQQHEIENLISNIKPDRTPEDLLFQAMLSLGLDLSCAISTQNIGGHTVYAVQSHAENEPTPAELLACFSVHTPECPGIDNTFVQELAKQKPLHVVFRDEGFKDSASKLNAWQFFKMISPHTEVHCL